jgi:hypothetical protein
MHKGLVLRNLPGSTAAVHNQIQGVKGGGRTQRYSRDRTKTKPSTAVVLPSTKTRSYAAPIQPIGNLFINLIMVDIMELIMNLKFCRKLFTMIRQMRKGRQLMLSQRVQPRASDSSNPHQRLLEYAWQNCRKALAICQWNESARTQALEFCRRANAVAPQHMQRWIELLEGGHAEHAAALARGGYFHNLPQEEQVWWDQLIQSAPFAPILGPLQRAQRKEKKRAGNKKECAHMKLEQFDHVCRAAAAVAGVKKVYAFGANAIIPWLAQSKHPIPLPGLTPSREIDISAGDEKLDTLIDGAIGELSAFDDTFSVYAHGVSLGAFKAPVNWRQRAGSRIEPVSGTEIVVPHPHDLIVSKLAAGRPKDFEFAVAAAKLFPITDNEVEQLVQEFRQAYPEMEKQLRMNFETWKRLMNESGAHGTFPTN